MRRLVIVATILALALATIVGLGLSLHSKSATLAQTTQSNEVLTQNLDTLKQTNSVLREENEQLRTSVVSLENHSEELQSVADRSQADVKETLEKLEDFETTVRENMEWFTSNSNLDNLSQYDEWKEELKSCARPSHKKTRCTIHSECIDKVNRDRGFNYQSDDQSTENIDFLKNLSTIYDHNGGDCEDFSLLYTAQYEYLIDVCVDEGVPREQILLASQRRADPIPAGFMYPVCGTFNPHEATGYLSGHCVVAVTGKEITDSSNVYEALHDATLIEPQTGEIIFDVDDNPFITIFDDHQIPETLFHISLVMTDNDLKIFYPWNDVIEWTGFEDFLQEAEELESNLQ